MASQLAWQLVDDLVKTCLQQTVNKPNTLFSPQVCKTSKAYVTIKDDDKLNLFS